MEQQTSAITAVGGHVVAIAVTATFSQQRFATDLGLGYPLLSDWNREVSRAWGVSYTEWKGHRGLAKRSVFVVDRGGAVAYAWATDDALQLPDIAAAVDALKALAPAA